MSIKNELFGDKVNVYKKLALDLNGNFSHGDFSNPVRVNIPYKNWVITADTFVTIEVLNVSKGNPYAGNSEHTRIRVPFLKRDIFQFAITTSTTLDSFANFFGSQDILVDDKEFDQQFTIKGTDVSMVRSIFSNPSIRKTLIEIQDVNLMLRDQEGYLGTQLPESINELFYKANEVIHDEKLLKSLIQLFCDLLDQLVKVGAAKEDSPNFKLV